MANCHGALRLCFLSVLFFPAIALSQTVPDEASQEKQEGILDEFRVWAKDFIVKPHSDLRLPDGWFEKQFGGKTGEKLTLEYAEFVKDIVRLPQLIRAHRGKGQTEVKVAVTVKAIDRDATGLQNAALQQMKQPVPLYTLRMVKPGEEKGFSLASFVRVDGKFCFAGKMSALNTKPDDLVASVLCNTPLSMMEGLLQEKGLLQGSAEDYLQKIGVLK